MNFVEKLRYLNSENINENKTLRDEFFSSLMRHDELKDYVIILAKSWSDGMEKDCLEMTKDEKIAEYLFNQKCTDAIKHDLSIGFFEEREDGIYIPYASSSLAPTYIGGIFGASELVKRSPNHFVHIKNNILEGLIIRHCNLLGSRYENVEYLDELLSIYLEPNVESRLGEKLSEPLKSIIDDEFISQMIGAKKNSSIRNEFNKAIIRLLNRKYPYTHTYGPYGEKYNDKEYTRTLKNR